MCFKFSCGKPPPLHLQRMAVLLHHCHLNNIYAAPTDSPPEMEIEFPNGVVGYVSMNTRFLTIILPATRLVVLTNSEEEFVARFTAMCNANIPARRESMLHAALVGLARRISLS